MSRLLIAPLAALPMTGCDGNLAGCLDGLRVRLARLTTFARLQYETQRPNGRGCDPVCRVATIAANVP